MAFRVSGLFLCLALSGAAQAVEPRTIVFFGDSLTAGYGLQDPAQESYPARIQRKIDSAHLPWRVVNAGLSGETSAGGLRRINWVLRQPMDLFVLELGANDGLRGLPVRSLKENLRSILERVRARHPAIPLVVEGMRMPTNLGDPYAAAFSQAFADVAKEENALLIPFLLEGVGGHAELNQPDGLHPTAKGEERVADTVWATLRPLLTSY
jgi:acyl-CoA thioesterase-1